MQKPDYQDFVAAMAKTGNQPEAACEALHKLTAETVGVKLFTITVNDPVAEVSRRIYSNMPEAYPVSGTKPADKTDWSRQVIEEKRIFVANTISDIAAVFPDHELIKSLGCESVINVPVVVEGEVLATINCLHEAGFYTSERVAAAEALKLPGAICVMLNTRNGGV
jgi:GAF domain-containing protein